MLFFLHEERSFSCAKKKKKKEEREYYVFSVRRAPKLILGLSHNLIYIFQVCVYNFFYFFGIHFSFLYFLRDFK